MLLATDRTACREIWGFGGWRSDGPAIQRRLGGWRRYREAFYSLSGSSSFLPPVMAPPLPPAMAPLSTVGVTEAEVIDLETMPPVGVPGGEVIDLESAECRSVATMAKFNSHSSGFHPKQQVSIRLFCTAKSRHYA